MGKVSGLANRRKHRTLADLLRQRDPVSPGWCNDFRHGVSAQTFNEHVTWWRVVDWLRKRPRRAELGRTVPRHFPGWEICDGQSELFRPRAVPDSHELAEAACLAELVLDRSARVR